MKILVVDDMKENLYLLETLLIANGYEVVSATNGVEALEKLRSDSIDMIISDILMPKMDGFQLCRECKSDKTLKKLPFIFYTATYTEKKDEEFALNLGADRFIVKPMEPECFIKTIKGILRDFEKGQLPLKAPTRKKETVYLKEYSERLIRKLEHKMLELERENAERKKVEVQRKKLLRDYKERVKELNCLYGVSRLIERADISLEGLTKESSELLPSAWQYPNITCAKITFGEREFKTTNFKETRWKQSADIRVHGKRVGTVEVYYLEERNELHEGPFLKEERDLIDTVADTLGRAVKRRWAEEALKESESKLSSILSSFIDLVFVLDTEGRFIFYHSPEEKLYAPPEVFMGKKYSEVLPPSIAKPLSKAIDGTKKGEVGEFEYRLKVGGETRWYSAKISSMIVEGEFRGTVIVTRDITDRKQMADRVRELVYRLYGIVPGGSYLSGSHEKCLKACLNLTLHGVPSLYIAREDPEDLTKNYDVKPKDIALLSSRPLKGFKVLSNLQEVSHTISEFIKADGGIVLLGGLEYLISRFGFNPVYKLLQDKRFDFNQAKAILLVPINLETLKEQQRAQLLAELKTLE